MKNKKHYRAVCLPIIISSILVLALFIQFQQSDSTLAKGDASGWLNGWQFRKSHDIAGAVGAGTGYQVKIKVFNLSQINALNAPNYSISTTGYLAENVVYDSVTAEYWWIFEDRTSSVTVKIASATSINGPWTVQSTPVIQETGHACTAPHLAKFGSYWYIYYGRSDGSSYENVDIWVQKSSNVNQSYSASGISNPILPRGSNDSWDSLRVFEPYAFEENGTYYLFYMGQNGTSSSASDAFELTGYATSSSPASGFMKYAGNPVIKPANHGWDSGADSSADPFVFKRNGVFYVGVTASSIGHSQTTSIGLYATTDFVNFSYYAGNPILSQSGGVNWDSTGVLRGAVSIFNDTYYLSYTGCSSSGNYGCGITTLSIIDSDNAGTVFVSGKTRFDFGDIRFTTSDGVTLLNYWMESKVDSDYAVFWVQVSDDLSSQNQTIYIYYGKTDAITTSNGTNTFLFFDDFSGDLSQWLPVAGTWTIENGNLTISPTSDNNCLVSANTVGTNSIAIRTKVRSEQAGDAQAHPGIIWHANNLTGNGQLDDQVYLRPHQYGSSSWANIQPCYYSRSLTWHDDKFGRFFDWNNWYTIEARLPPSGNVKLYGNDVYWHDWGNQQYSYNHIGVVAHVDGKDYWDYVLVRKYVDPEPLHGDWGSQETAPTTINHSQMAFDFQDLDNNNVTSRVAWQLYNRSQLLNYTEGEYSLLDGKYTLKTTIDSYLIDVRSLDTATYGNSTVTIILQMKQHNSTPDGYIVSNNTISSINIQNDTMTNLTFTVNGLPGKLLVKVPHNAEYIKKDGLYVQVWTWDYPSKVILLDSTNSTYEFSFLMPQIP